MVVVVRLISLAIGYVFGLFQTGYLYGRLNGIDIRKEGSGNAGTTNTLRVLGPKAGLITFLGDFLKAVFAVMVVFYLFRNNEQYQDCLRVLQMYAGFGVVLGHNFPCYLKFQGGKGIASTAGVVVAVYPPIAPLSLIIFIVTVALTRYVSLGSILAVLSFMTQILVFGQLGKLYCSNASLYELYAVCACFTLMALWRHRANIVRLINGTERKLGVHEKTEEQTQEAKTEEAQAEAQVTEEFDKMFADAPNATAAKSDKE